MHRSFDLASRSIGRGIKEKLQKTMLIWQATNDFLRQHYLVQVIRVCLSPNGHPCLALNHPQSVTISQGNICKILGFFRFTRHYDDGTLLKKFCPKGRFFIRVRKWVVSATQCKSTKLSNKNKLNRMNIQNILQSILQYYLVPRPPLPFFFSWHHA